MYKILGVYVFSVNPFPVANLLTADNNDARKPPTISYMWALPPSVKDISTDNLLYNMKKDSQRTNSTFASSNAQADSSTCKRAISYNPQTLIL